MERSWKNSTVYQVYPRSFAEKRADPADLRGEGSLQGITEKLDYLQDLGVDAIWLTPFYPSPMIDGGYDISNYQDVDPRYGNLADFDEMVEKAHSRDIKIMIDFVANHTSTEHPWFREHPDRYVRRPPNPDGSPPNNWTSVFSKSQLRARENGELVIPDGEPTPALSAWQFDEARGDFYLHTFATEQADLDWQNPEVQQAMTDVMRFWIERGVDGFRVDAINHAGKNPDFSDEAPNPDYKEGTDNPYDQWRRQNSANYAPALFPILRKITGVLDEYPKRDLRIVFEAYVDDAMIQKIDRIAPEKASSFYFPRLDAPWSARRHKRLLDAQFGNLPENGSAIHVTGNHDKPRLATRLGRSAARTAAVINLTLPGMPFIYQGEEGGFTDVDVPPELRTDLLGERDGVRTPMLWTPGKNAGFSDADATWLPIAPDYLAQNLETQAADPRSSFSLYRTLLHMRKSETALQNGDYTPLHASHPDVLGYAVRTSREQIITLANFSDRPVSSGIWRTQQVMGRVILSSADGQPEREVNLGDNLTLAPNESLVIGQF